MKAQLENILAELDAIDKIEIDSIGVMMDVLQKMDGLIGSLGAMYEEFQSMPQDQAYCYSVRIFVFVSNALHKVVLKQITRGNADYLSAA